VVETFKVVGEIVDVEAVEIVTEGVETVARIVEAVI
jgi:hypothetical protein